MEFKQWLSKQMPSNATTLIHTHIFLAIVMLPWHSQGTERNQKTLEAEIVATQPNPYSQQGLPFLQNHALYQTSKIPVKQVSISRTYRESDCRAEEVMAKCKGGGARAGDAFPGELTHQLCREGISSSFFCPTGLW